MIGWLDTSIKLPPLKKGKHDSSDDGLCFMEMVAFMERLPHSDKPECTCPIIANFMIGLNDYFPSDNKRNLLLPYLPKVVGTVSPEHEQERTEYLAWSALTIFAPIALRAAGMFAGAVELADFDRRLGLAKACKSADWFARIAWDNRQPPPPHLEVLPRTTIVGDVYAIAWGACAHSSKSAEMAIAATSSPYQMSLEYANTKRISSVQNAAQVFGVARCSYNSLNGEIYDRCFKVLDGLLAIGPQSKGFTSPERQRELSMLV
jgi:hypothetical protein